MCGICGVWEYGAARGNVQRDLLVSMSNVMTHRGPDDAGDRARAHLEVDALQHVAAAVTRNHTGQAQHQTPTGSSSESPR